MRRAFVISLFVHLLAFGLLLEGPGLPPDLKGMATVRSPANITIRSLASSPVSFVSPSADVEPASEERPVRAWGDKKHTEARSNIRRSYAPASNEPIVEHPESTEAAAGLPEDVERQYRIELARAMRKRGNFPINPSQPGVEGMVMLEVSRRAGAVRPTLSLAKSSGHREWDTHALDSLTAALEEVVPPRIAPNAGFRMLVVLEYR